MYEIDLWYSKPDLFYIVYFYALSLCRAHAKCYAIMRSVMIHRYLGMRPQEQNKTLEFQNFGRSTPGSYIKLTRQASISYEKVVLMCVTNY